MRTHSRNIRIASSLVLLVAFGTVAMEIRVSDERRTEMSAVVFTGTVTNVQRLPLVRTNAAAGLGSVQDLGVWRAEVLVESVVKEDVELGKVAFVYYPQRPISLSGRATFAGRVCPGYPIIETNMTATFWCHRCTIEGNTNVLYVSMPSWVRSQ